MSNQFRPIQYKLRDSHTGQVVKSYANRDAATRAADRKDAQYGAVRFIVEPVWEDQVEAPEVRSHGKY